MAKGFRTSRIFSSAILMAGFIFSPAQFSLCLKSVEPLRQQFPTTSFVEQMSVSNEPGVELMLYADPMDISGKPKIGDCIKNNKAYGPNTHLILATTAMSWMACQRECELLEGCAFFNLHLVKTMGNCYLYKSTALQQYNVQGVVSGPKRCGNPFSCFQNKIDMPGHDIDSTTLNTAEECRKHCLSHPDCEFFLHFIQGSKKTCWRKRKAAVHSMVLNLQTTSGPKHCHPQWCFMNDISLNTSGPNLITTVKNIDSASSCQLKCQENSVCETWTYKASRDCFLLHSDLSSKQNASDSISGLRNCGNTIHGIVGKNFHGPDLRTINGVASSEKCQLECYKDVRCHYFTLNVRQNRCFLHSMLAASRTADSTDCQRGVVIPGVGPRPPV